MGRGNWLPGNRGELVDWEGYYVDYQAIYGDNYEDSWRMEYFIEDLASELTGEFDDLMHSEAWRNNEERVILDDFPIQLVLGDNESSVAVYFVLHDIDEYEYEEDEVDKVRQMLGEKFSDYTVKLKEILMGAYGGFVYQRSGAWTSSKVE